RQADKYDVPRICFINKMDKVGADFEHSVQTIRDRLGVRPLVVQVAIGQEGEFEGVVDLVSMQAITWRGDVSKGAKYEIEEVPQSLTDTVAEYRGHLLEAVAESDEELFEKYFGGEELSEADIRSGIRQLTINREGFPVLCGSAFKNKGIQPLLDAVLSYLPSPLDIPSVSGMSPDGETELTRTASTSEPFTALAFKVAVHQFYGKLTYIRVYSGKIDQSTQVLNASTGRKERIGKLFQMHSNKENPVDEGQAGHIYAVQGLKNTSTGDTLCDMQQTIVLESMSFPDTVIEVAIEQKTKSYQDKLSTAIKRRDEEDPTFKVKHDEETGQSIIAGMGELQLDVLVNRMKSDFKVEANIGKPQVAYRETIRKPVEKHEFTHKKQTGGYGQFAQVIIGLERLCTCAA